MSEEESQDDQDDNDDNISEDDREKQQHGEDEDDDGDWGTSKRDYYDNDEVVTQEDAKAEVEEAIRLQKKKLAKMKAADYGLNELEWLDKAKDEPAKKSALSATVSEVLQPWVPRADMTASDHEKILHSWYPEFEHLVNEISELGPVLQDLTARSAGKGTDFVSSIASPRPLEIKIRALASYVSTIAMYFALLSSPSETEGRAMNPQELHEHEVMDCLVQTRAVWSKVKDLPDDETPVMQSPTKKHLLETDNETEQPVRKSRKTNTVPTSVSMRAQRDVARAAEAAEREVQKQLATEAELATLTNLLPKAPSQSAKRKTDSAPTYESDTHSDFGEESHLTAAGADEKAKRKKSLRFYTSQIVQKSSKRHDAGRDAGGDNDLPHRERLRDRQARLNAEAEARGRKLDSYGRGTALGGDDDDDNIETSNLHRRTAGDADDDDEYYDMVASRTQQRKSDKRAHAAAVNAPVTSLSEPLDAADAPSTGKRAIGYTIEKNKGLAPKRKKEVRNPRVKKRMKYEERKKKLGSTRATYKGGEGRGGYGGEMTGIKSNLVKSVKL